MKIKLDPIDKRKKTYYHADQKHAGYEVRDISWITLLWIGIVIIVGISIFIVFLDSYFSVVKEQEIYTQVLKVESNELREMRAKEHELLTTYGKVDGKKNVYHIPIDRAMQLLAEEDFKNGQ